MSSGGSVHGSSKSGGSLRKGHRRYQNYYNAYLVGYTAQLEFITYTGQNVDKAQTVQGGEIEFILYKNFNQHFQKHGKKLTALAQSIYWDHHGGATKRLYEEFDKASPLKALIIKTIQSYHNFAKTSTSISRTPHRELFLNNATELQSILAPPFNYNLVASHYNLSDPWNPIHLSLCFLMFCRVVNTEVHNNGTDADSNVLKKKNRHWETYRKKYITHMRSSAENDHEFLLGVVSAYGTDARLYPSSVLEMMEEKKMLKPNFSGVTTSQSKSSTSSVKNSVQNSSIPVSNPAAVNVKPTPPPKTQVSQFPPVVKTATPPLPLNSHSPLGNHNIPITAGEFFNSVKNCWKLFYGEETRKVIPVTWYNSFFSKFPVQFNRDNLLTNSIEQLLWDAKQSKTFPNYKLPLLPDEFPKEFAAIKEQLFVTVSRRTADWTPAIGWEDLMTRGQSLLQLGIKQHMITDTPPSTNGVPFRDGWCPSQCDFPFDAFQTYVNFYLRQNNRPPLTDFDNVMKMRYVEYLNALIVDDSVEFLIGTLTAYGPNILCYPMRVICIIFYRALFPWDQSSQFNELFENNYDIYDLQSKIVHLPIEPFGTKSLSIEDDTPETTLEASPTAEKMQIGDEGVHVVEETASKVPVPKIPNDVPTSPAVGKLQIGNGGVSLVQEASTQVHIPKKQNAVPASSAMGKIQIGNGGVPAMQDKPTKVQVPKIPNSGPVSTAVGKTPLPNVKAPSPLISKQQSLTISAAEFTAAVAKCWKLFYGDKATTIPTQWYDLYISEFPFPNNRDGILNTCINQLILDQQRMKSSPNFKIWLLSDLLPNDYLRIMKNFDEAQQGHSAAILNSVTGVAPTMLNNVSYLQLALIKCGDGSVVPKPGDWCPSKSVFPFGAFRAHVFWYFRQEKNKHKERLNLGEGGSRLEQIIQLRYAEYLNLMTENSKQFIRGVFTAYGPRVNEYPIRVLQILQERELLRKKTPLYDYIGHFESQDQSARKLVYSRLDLASIPPMKIEPLKTSEKVTTTSLMPQTSPQPEVSAVVAAVEKTEEAESLSTSFKNWRSACEQALEEFSEDGTPNFDIPESYYVELYESYKNLVSVKEPNGGHSEGDIFSLFILGVWSGTQLMGFQQDMKSGTVDLNSKGLSFQHEQNTNGPLRVESNSTFMTSNDIKIGTQAIVSVPASIRLTSDAIAVLPDVGINPGSNVDIILNKFVNGKKNELEALEKIHEEFPGEKIQDFVNELCHRSCWITSDEDMRLTAMLISGIMEEKLISKSYVIHTLKHGVIKNLPFLVVKVVKVTSRVADFMVHLFQCEEDFCWFLTLTEDLSSTYLPVWIDLVSTTVRILRRKTSEEKVMELFARTPGSHVLVPHM